MVNPAAAAAAGQIQTEPTLVTAVLAAAAVAELMLL
jgi:hypothetical protein